MPKILAVYTDARIPKILMLGVISGLPWVLFGAMMTLWLKDEGFSRSAIGLFGYISIVYAINFLWAPIIDNLKIPYLTNRLGHRKVWILLMQLIILSATLALYLSSTTIDIWMIALLGFIIATASSTQDIAIDAMRIEMVGKKEQGLMAIGAACATAGWYSGYNLGGAYALYLADWFKNIGISNPWQTTFLAMVLIIVITNLLLLLIKESPRDTLRPRPVSLDTTSLARRLLGIGIYIKDAFWQPLATFFKYNGLYTAICLLGFIVLFKIGEAFLGRMSLLFYKEVGFTEADIATYSKIIGWGVIVVFSFIGSLFSFRYGLFRGLLICGVAMAATNLMFSWLALVGPDPTLFAFAVIADQFTTAISTVAFVAFISQLCNRAYTATQYALFASLGNLARTTLSSHSGQVVDSLGGEWHIFFIITALMVIPSLVLLVLSRERLGRYF